MTSIVTNRLMNLIEVFDRFPDQESCIAHLENSRWSGDPVCPHCGSKRVGRKKENDRIGRWNSYGSYNVLSGTIFENTRIPLQKWFLAIAIVLVAKKGVSSPQLARHLDRNQKASWHMAMKIREGMKEDGRSLEGIVEVDETFVTWEKCKKRGD